MPSSTVHRILRSLNLVDLNTASCQPLTFNSSIYSQRTMLMRKRSACLIRGGNIDRQTEYGLTSCLTHYRSFQRQSFQQPITWLVQKLSLPNQSLG